MQNGNNAQPGLAFHDKAKNKKRSTGEIGKLKNIRIFQDLRIDMYP